MTDLLQHDFIGTELLHQITLLLVLSLHPAYPPSPVPRSTPCCKTLLVCLLVASGDVLLVPHPCCHPSRGDRHCRWPLCHCLHRRKRQGEALNLCGPTQAWLLYVSLFGILRTPIIPELIAHVKIWVFLGCLDPGYPPVCAGVLSESHRMKYNHAHASFVRYRGCGWSCPPT